MIVWSDSLYFSPYLLASAPWPDKNWSILEAEVPDVANNHQCFDQVFVEFPDFYLRSISHQGPLWKGTGKTGKLLLVESFQLGRFLLREKYYSEKNVKMERLVKTKALRTGLGSHSKIFFYWHFFTWSRSAIHLIHLTFQRLWRSRPWTKDESES